MRDDSADRNPQARLRASLSRRSALKLAGGAALATSLGARIAYGREDSTVRSPTQPEAPSRRPKRVIIAGGGIGGLCCAHELVKRGHDVTVLEAAGRIGGHVRTLRDPLADGLYVDGGAEHFTRPGYELFWGHVKEFGLEALPYPRRQNMLRLIDGRLHTEEMLADPKVLAGFGFNPREMDFLAREPWWKLPALYFAPYVDAFPDEYKPFEAGLDRLDAMTLDDLLKKDGASAAAIRFIGDSHASALHSVWHAGLLKRRGVPLFPPEVFRLKGGNQTLPDTFNKHLGERVRLGCPVTGIERGDTGVKVRYREAGRDKTMEADWLVSAMSLVKLREVPVTPAWPEARQYVVQNFPYYTASRPIFQSRTRFWERDKVSPNVVLGESTLEHVWRMADDVDTPRGLIVGTAVGFTTAQNALATFRKVYPGATEDIEQALVIDWAKDPWAMACEPVNYAPGQLHRFWPKVIEPEGRIQFVGAYADNLNWGMEAATRSAHRVAKAIDQA
jgi:monoamine oxidase